MKNSVNKRVLVAVGLLLIFSILVIIKIPVSVASPAGTTEIEPKINWELVQEDLHEVLKTTTTTTTTTKNVKVTKKTTTTTTKNYSGHKSGLDWIITHYGPDCKGCSGTTASGYKVKNTIYYNDKTYGKLRIVAAPKIFKLYTVLKIKTGKETYYAIVLDRGGAIKGNKLDLLVESEKKSSKLGVIKNAKVEILRSGK